MLYYLLLETILILDKMGRSAVEHLFCLGRVHEYYLFLHNYFVLYSVIINK